MICARCNQDSRKKDRTFGKCPHCGGAFAFKQERNDPISDLAFARAIEAVSAKGQVRWGVEHLYYEVSRRVRPSNLKLALIPAALAASVGIAQATHWRPAVMLILAAGLIALAYWIVRSRRKKTNMLKEQFDELWSRWRSTHGVPQGLIVRRHELGQTTPRATEPDLALYSFDRAVVCDRARTVDLLLANNFHFENNCAVLSVDGYPRAVFDTVVGMLRRNPRLHIFALHDCTRDGCALARKLASEPKWFAGQTVVDVGLRPVHARSLPNLIPAQQAAVPALGISSAELEWLARYNCELAVLRPEQILRRLFRAMNKSDESDSGSSGGDSGGSGDGGVQTDEDSFTVDVSADDSGSDAFG